MSALFRNSSFFQHNNPVGISDRFEAVSDNDYRPPRNQGIDSLLHFHFIFFIRQNKDLRDELNGEIYRKGQLQAEIEAEKAALAHREEELQETRKQKQFLEEELERMRQRKVVRMADKVQHVIKRSK